MQLGPDKISDKNNIFLCTLQHPEPEAFRDFTKTYIMPTSCTHNTTTTLYTSLCTFNQQPSWVSYHCRGQGASPAVAVQSQVFRQQKGLTSAKGRTSQQAMLRGVRLAQTGDDLREPQGHFLEERSLLRRRDHLTGLGVFKHIRDDRGSVTK